MKNILCLSLFSVGTVFSMEVSKPVKSHDYAAIFCQLSKLREDQLYGSTLALTKRPIAKVSGEWKCELPHEHIERKDRKTTCIMSHKDNIKSGNYILALLAVLKKDCTFEADKIISFEDLTKNFIIEQPGIQEEIANRVVHKEMIEGKLEKNIDNLGNKSLPDCIKETFRSFEQDQNDTTLYYLDTTPIENYVLHHYSAEIAEKCQTLIEEKRNNHTTASAEQFVQVSQNSWRKFPERRLINNCQWCSNHYEGEIRMNKPQVISPQPLPTPEVEKAKSKWFFARLFIGLCNWFSRGK